MLEILLGLTFVFGPLKLITYLKIFGVHLCNPLEAIFAVTNRARTTFLGFLVWLDNLIFYACLFFQAGFWIKYFMLIN